MLNISLFGNSTLYFFTPVSLDPHVAGIKRVQHYGPIVLGISEGLSSQAPKI